MSGRVSRRRLIQGAAAAAVVVGFDPVSRAWAAAPATPDGGHAGGPEVGAAGRGVDRVPPLDGELVTDPAALAEAADDYGHIVHRTPTAVLRPGSYDDVAAMVRYARRHGIQVAMRGQGHATQGQAQVAAGLVIDSRTLATIHSIDRRAAVVDAGVTWGQLLNATAPRGLTPPVLTDYMWLSVGGTAAGGGVGGATGRHGAQIDTITELLVVTGRGDLVRCSERERRDLFDAVLGGNGQFGIVVRATVRLARADTDARVYQLYYDDLDAYLADQVLLLRERRFAYLEGQAQPRPDGAPGWRFMIEAVQYFTPPAAPDDAALLAGLSDDRAQAVITPNTYLGWAFRLDPAVEYLKAIGDWYRPHPLLDVFVPASRASQVVGDALATLTALDIGIGPILLYPVDTRRMTRPSFQVPAERDAFLLSLLRTTANADPALLDRQLASNRAIHDANRAAGGTWYPIGSLPDVTQADWRAHHGRRWPTVVANKRRFDPDHVLTPGQRVF